MADEGRNPLELDVVTRRFAESADALANVRGKLEVLAKLYDAEEKANASLQEASGQVERFVAQAAAILRGLQDAQTRVIEALKSGSDLLDGTELKGITESVNANSQAIAKVGDSVRSLASIASEMRDDFQSVAETAKAIANIGGHVTALDTSVSRLSEEAKGIPEAVRANSQSIDNVGKRLTSLDARMSEVANMLASLKTTVEDRFDSLDRDITNIRADVKEPIIIKRFF